MELLSNLRELEEKCVEDMEELLGNFEETAYAKVACIFQHMAEIELNFYKWWQIFYGVMHAFLFNQ